MIVWIGGGIAIFAVTLTVTLSILLTVKSMVLMSSREMVSMTSALDNTGI